jgi:hypothetical protein
MSESKQRIKLENASNENRATIVLAASPETSDFSEEKPKFGARLMCNGSSEGFVACDVVAQEAIALAGECKATGRPRCQGRPKMALIGAQRKPLTEEAGGPGAQFGQEGLSREFKTMLHRDLGSDVPTTRRCGFVLPVSEFESELGAAQDRGT